MGNVELFELCETIPKVQCSECLLYWNQGMVCCTCGHLLRESESNQHFNQWPLDAFSIPNYVIKEGATSWCSARQNWGTEGTFRGPQCAEEMYQKRILMEFTIASNEIQKIVIRNSKIGWTEEKCIEMDNLAQENHSCCPSSEEYERYQQNWYICTEQIRQKCTDETPIGLPNSSHNYEPSPPRI